MRRKVHAVVDEIADHKQAKEGSAMKALRLRTGILLLLLLLSMSIPLAAADRGMIPVVPNVIYEPGQKAIIAWSGEKEILILSTDVLSSSANTTVLEILPLPSMPSVIEEGNLESFSMVQSLVWWRMPPSLNGYWGNETDAVKVVFYEKIGVHGITVVEVHNVSNFVEWVRGFLLTNGISKEISLKSFEPIVEDYVMRGFNFFVLDLIELSSTQKSVEPILFMFDTSFLYYPLTITSPIGGDGKIVLFVITQTLVRSGYSPFTKASYVFQDYQSVPIEFELSHEDISLIDSRVGALFEGNAWMTVLTYEGSLASLTEDLVLNLIRGDLNADGRVDISDLVVAAIAFGSRPGNSRWNFEADINMDHVVNIIDIVLIVTKLQVLASI